MYQGNGPGDMATPVRWAKQDEGVGGGEGNPLIVSNYCLVIHDCVQIIL